jgi:hypothetical protein
MQIRMLSTNDWRSREKGNPICLAELPLSVREAEKILGVEFVQYVEDGLGECFCCAIEIDGQDVFLQGVMHRDSKAIGVTVNMHATEPDPNKLLDNICAALHLSRRDLKWTHEFDDSPKYVVYRVDDNGNEFEMERFHEKPAAEWFAKRYQEKGHKQIYLVRDVA